VSAPRGRIVVALLGAVSLVVAVADLSRDRSLASVTRLSHAAREQAPAASVDVDTRLFDAARRAVPRNATFAVVVGDGQPVSGALAHDAVAPLAAFSLLPRRAVPYPTQADWVLLYGTDDAGVPLRRVAWRDDGMLVGEVRR
jgi:hypothetical protein